jgi:hypothetical protein
MMARLERVTGMTADEAWDLVKTPIARSRSGPKQKAVPKRPAP